VQSPSPRLSAAFETVCNCPQDCGTDQGFAEGKWEMQVDRAWDHDLADVQFPSDSLDEDDYQPVSNGTVYPVVASAGAASVSIGEAPLLGELVASTAGTWTYDLSAGTFAGGRFVVWATLHGLQAELTIYGSGVPIVSSERGALLPVP